MDKETIRTLFDYHLEFNKRLLDYCKESLTNAQFIQEFDYSHRSVRNLLAHMLDVDNRWLCGLLGKEPPDFPSPTDYPSISVVHERWYKVNKRLRKYLDEITDFELEEPFVDKLKKWEVLFHMVNHATHHRAQVYCVLNKLGFDARPQDYALYSMGRI